MNTVERQRSIVEQEIAIENPAKYGLLGFLLGIASLIIILIQLSTFFEPQAESTGSVIGEIATDIKQSAARALSGETAPKPTPPPQDFGQLATIVALCAAGLAVVLGGVGSYRNEPHWLSYLAVGFGLSAFVMQYVFWLAILICGIALLISIVENLGSIFD